MKSLVFIVLGMIGCLSMTAKDYLVLDSDSVPLCGATLWLQAAVDSTVLETAITDVQGRASLNNTSPDDILQAYIFGYLPYVNSVRDTGEKIVLHEDAKTLSELVVSASADHVKTEAGKITFTPGELKTQVTDMASLFKFTPMIKIENNRLSIANKPTKVFINGEELKIPDQFLMQYLNALTTKDVISIELMPNGNNSYSAIYGVINIRMVDQTQGLKGSLSTEGRYADSRFNTYDVISLSYARGKFVADFIASYNFRNTYRSTTSTYDYAELGKSVIEDTRKTNRGHGLGGQLKLGYKFNSKSLLSLWMAIYTRSNDYNNHSVSTISIDDKQENHSFTSSYKTPLLRPYVSLVANWNYITDSKGSTLDITADYYDSDNSYNHNYMEDDYCYTRFNSYIKRGVHAAAKYTWKLSSTQSISGQYEFSDSYLHNEALDPTYASSFRYSEIMNSPSILWRAEWSSFFNTGISLKYQATESNVQRGYDIPDFNRKYNFVIPSISMSAYLPSAQQSFDFNLGYSQSLPYFSYLDPQRIWTSSTTYYEGNPELTPSKNLNGLLRYSVLGCVFVTAYASHDFEEALDYNYMKDGYTVTSYANMGSTTTAMLQLQFLKTFWNFWRLNISCSGQYQRFRGGLENINMDYTNLMGSFSMNNMFTISRKHNLTASLTYIYRSPNRTPTFRTNSLHNVGLDITKIFTNGMSVSLSAYNLNNLNIKTSYHSPGYSYSTVNNNCQMSFRLHFQYTFGKKQVDTGYTPSQTYIENR